VLRQTPALQAAFFEEHERSIELFAALIARRLRRPADDLDVRIACGALVGALQEAFNIWLARGGKGGSKRISEILDRAITRCESVLRF